MRIALLLAFSSAVFFPRDGKAQAAKPQGIPIDDPLVIRRCGGCHQRDANGMMGRLSYIRTSPEVWDQAIKRMIRLNGLTLTRDELRDILRYLSSNNGLAPEEMKPGFWEVEHRTVGYQSDFTPNPALQATCNACHSIGRVLAQRRTREDYEKLVAMHIGLFPGAAYTYRPVPHKPVSDEKTPAHQVETATGGVTMEYPKASMPPSQKYPVDIALDYLASAQPLITPEWTAWKAAMRPQKLAGTWLLRGYQPGKGRIYGRVIIAPGAGEDQFTTNIEFSYVSSGATVKSSGKGIVYTGYSWRGRVAAPGSNTVHAITATAIPTGWREAMLVSRDGNSMDGRWFWGGFGELGIDVHLMRAANEPVVLGTDLSALQSPSKATVKIYGANLPATLKAGDVDFGNGVKVTKVVSVTGSLATVDVEVAQGLLVGMHDLAIGRASVKDALAVYDKIAYIQVEPDAQMSRLGGIRYPKEYSQFEAVAYAAGPDGKPGTDDDISLGPVSARWALEEFVSTPDDDDVKFVGSLDDAGLFTPNVEGPNPQRKKQANNFPVENYGDVWVVASYKDPGGDDLKARAYLVVTVPNYTIYDQPEVGQ
ncbi:MAG TPA: quinohemoprotein amine dehydrogenase subunit alpha [Bryobacteraceae bacterium]|nr:quinohemoprotein amine dehydrogenase subunit alpha [Bryobacteraceae bacterium]